MTSVKDYTYQGYEALIHTIRTCGYTIVDYHNCDEVQRPCILRHDVDNDLTKAVALARLEEKHQVKATYFVLLSGEFYNVFSPESRSALREIISLGHEIGLHYDQTVYEEDGSHIERIREEAEILSALLPTAVSTVSMHRPSKEILAADLQIPQVVNSYGMKFFHDYKYLSDSRHEWREDVDAVVEGKQFSRLHILTHPFWYTENPTSCREKLLAYLRAGNRARYESMNRNFRDLGEFVAEGEV